MNGEGVHSIVTSFACGSNRALAAYYSAEEWAQLACVVCDVQSLFDKEASVCMK